MVCNRAQPSTNKRGCLTLVGAVGVCFLSSHQENIGRLGACKKGSSCVRRPHTIAFQPLVASHTKELLLCTWNRVRSGLLRCCGWCLACGFYLSTTKQGWRHGDFWVCSLRNISRKKNIPLDIIPLSSSRVLLLHVILHNYILHTHVLLSFENLPEITDSSLEL